MSFRRLSLQTHRSWAAYCCDTRGCRCSWAVWSRAPWETTETTNNAVAPWSWMELGCGVSLANQKHPIFGRNINHSTTSLWIYDECHWKYWNAYRKTSREILWWVGIFMEGWGVGRGESFSLYISWVHSGWCFQPFFPANSRWQLMSWMAAWLSGEPTAIFGESLGLISPRHGTTTFMIRGFFLAERAFAAGVAGLRFSAALRRALD